MINSELVYLTKILCESRQIFIPVDFFSKVTNRATELITNNWAIGMGDAEININAFSGALKEITDNEIYFNRTQVNLFDDNELIRRSMYWGKKRRLNSGPCIFIWNSIAFHRYYLMEEVHSNLVNIIRGNTSTRILTNKELHSKTLISDTNYSEVRGFSFTCKIRNKGSI